MIFPRSWWRLTWIWLFKGGNFETHDQKLQQKPLSLGSIRAAVVALSLGVCALSLTLAVFSGFEHLLAERVISNNGHLRYEASRWMKFDQLPSTLQELPVPVSSMEMFWSAPVMVVGRETGRGVRAEVRRNFASLTDKLGSEKPKFISVSLSKSLADFLGLGVGDSFRAVIPGFYKKAIPLRLTGFDGVGLHHVDSRRILIDELDLRRYMQHHNPEALERMPGDFHALRLFVDESKADVGFEGLKELSLKLQSYFQERSADALGQVVSWRQEQHNFFGGIANDKRLVSIIMAMLIIVASLNVATSLLVLFFEKDRQIALIRALGMSKRQLMQWTSLQGLMMGVIASMFGFVASFLLAQVLPRLPFLELPRDIYNVTQLPVRFDMVEQLLILCFGVVSALGVAFVLGLMLSRMSIVGVMGHRR